MSGTVETVPMAFTVCGVERVNGRGALVGLAVVEVDVAGGGDDVPGCPGGPHARGGWSAAPRCGATLPAANGCPA